MTEKRQTGATTPPSLGNTPMTEDERLAVISSYLDGELTGSGLAAFEALLRSDQALAQEVKDLQRINRQLTEVGAGILSEPIPDSLLEVLSRRPGG